MVKLCGMILRYTYTVNTLMTIKIEDWIVKTAAINNTAHISSRIRVIILLGYIRTVQYHSEVYNRVVFAESS